MDNQVCFEYFCCQCRRLILYAFKSKPIMTKPFFLNLEPELLEQSNCSLLEQSDHLLLLIAIVIKKIDQHCRIIMKDIVFKEE